MQTSFLLVTRDQPPVKTVVKVLWQIKKSPILHICDKLAFLCKQDPDIRALLISVPLTAMARKSLVH